MKVVETLRIRAFRAGYELRSEVVDPGDGSRIPWVAAYSIHGICIGSSKVARRLAKLGIVPELATPKAAVCTVGYSTKDGRWYGWSHRAICGFKIGDRIFEERFGNNKTPFRKHGRREVKTLADARKAAVAFARSVS